MFKKPVLKLVLVLGIAVTAAFQTPHRAASAVPKCDLEACGGCCACLSWSGRICTAFACC